MLCLSYAYVMLFDQIITEMTFCDKLYTNAGNHRLPAIRIGRFTPLRGLGLGRCLHKMRRYVPKYGAKCIDFGTDQALLTLLASEEIVHR